MNLIDQLNQPQLAATALVTISAIGGAWKVFHELYVKPRDFKITSLKEDLATLRDEVVRLRRDQATQQIPPPKSVTKKTEQTELQIDPLRRDAPPVAKGSPLSSLVACYNQWNDESLTKLQKQKFETDYTGKQVTWRVQVDSVSEAEHNRIILYVKEPGPGWERARASANFPISDQELLLSLKTDDWIILRGTIAEFFLWPNIDHCQIEKTERP